MLKTNMKNAALRLAFISACGYAEMAAALRKAEVRVLMGYGGATMVDGVPQPTGIHIHGLTGCEAVVDAQRERGRRFRLLRIYGPEGRRL